MVTFKTENIYVNKKFRERRDQHLIIKIGWTKYYFNQFILDAIIAISNIFVLLKTGLFYHVKAFYKYVDI